MPSNTSNLIARARQAAKDDLMYVARGGQAELLDELSGALEDAKQEREVLAGGQIDGNAFEVIKYEEHYADQKFFGTLLMKQKPKWDNFELEDYFPGIEGTGRVVEWVRHLDGFTVYCEGTWR